MRGGATFAKADINRSFEIANLYLRVWSNEYPLLDFGDPQFIEDCLRSGNYVWGVAEIEGKIIGSAVGIIDRWNNSAELGRTVVDPNYNGFGIAKRLCEQVRDEVLESSEIIWGSLRNSAMYKISLNDGMNVVGYFPGEYLVKTRELQLMGMRLTNAAKDKRIISSRSEVYDLPAVKEIISNMDLSGLVGDYPKDVVVGTKRGDKLSFEGFYFSPNRALVLGSFGLPSSPLPEYIQATVLADKIEHIGFFQKLGFSVTGFLPAWYSTGESRYDCVLLTNPLVGPVPQDDSLRKIVEKLKEGFGGSFYAG